LHNLVTFIIRDFVPLELICVAIAIVMTVWRRSLLRASGTTNRTGLKIATAAITVACLLLFLLIGVSIGSRH
jgi:hypothetical protein